MMQVSVVIPCYNEEQYIVACMDAACIQELPAGVKLRVLVCDGRSTDRTAELVREYAATHPQVTCLLNEQRTTPYALNLGIRHAAADVVIIFGAHAVMKPGYIARCIEAFSAYADVGCAGGILTNIYENETSRIIGLAMSSPFGVGNAHFRTGASSGYVDTVAFGAYKKEVFDTVGFFDEELVRNQDDEFNFRVLKQGFRIWLDPEIRADYYVRSSVKRLFRQYFQYGYWKVYVNKKHRAITTTRQLIPFGFVLFLVFGSVAAACSRLLAMAFFGVLALYALLALYFAFRKTSHPVQAIKITGIFVSLHLSYGWGYLLGAIDFILRNKSAGKFQTTSR